MKTVDQIYSCEMPGQVFGTWQVQCRIRIFQPHVEVQTVMVTDMGFEMGWFIPYLIEKLVDQVVNEFCLDPAKLVWIECYTPALNKPGCADFSQVILEWHNGKAQNPQWQPIAPAMAQIFINQELLTA